LIRFEVNIQQQAVYFKPCYSCSVDDFKKVYYLTLICQDLNGKGNIGFASLIIQSQNSYPRNGFRLANKIYYLLAIGPSGTDIPKLQIKVSLFSKLKT
jgi:hypothetical protein